MWQLEAFSVRSRQMVVALFGALLIVLCCGLGWYVIGQLERSSERALVAKSVVADVLPPPMYLVEMRLVLSQAVEGTLDPVKAAAEVDRLQHDYEGRVRHWQSTPPFGLERHLLGDQHRYGIEFIGATRKVLQALADGRRDEARSLLAQSHESYLQHRREVDRTVVEGSRMADAEAEIMARSSGRARGGLLLILLLGLTGMGALAWLISRSIVQPLQTAVGVAEAVAAGNLAVSVPTGATRSDDQHELGKLQAALGRMCHGLGLIVSQVRSAGLGAAEASAQLAAGNQDLRSRTQQHQQELENCCASLKEVAGLVEQNAGSAQNAKELASVVSGMAGRGIGVVDELAALMRTISGSSGRVGEIVSLIESIAFQTNLLALNAAVEAARAGEQGRGFAVVAAEVRQLANRSSRAAAEIKTLVEGSGAEIAEGSRHAVSVETTIKDMVTQVEAMSRLVVEIWENTFTQSSAINLLTDSMQVLADASSANVALVTQTSGLASKLQSDAADLARSVSVFTLPGATRPAFRGG